MWDHKSQDAFVLQTENKMHIDKNFWTKSLAAGRCNEHFLSCLILKIIQIIATSDVHLTQSVSRTTPETSEVLQVKRWSGITKTHKQWIIVGKIMLGVILTSQIGVNEWSSDAREARGRLAAGHLSLAQVAAANSLISVIPETICHRLSLRKFWEPGTEFSLKDLFSLFFLFLSLYSNTETTLTASQILTTQWAFSVANIVLLVE